MERFVLKRNLQRDPLTGLNNYIEFIEEDHSQLFGNEGRICIFRIASLVQLNAIHGREAGDVAIRTAAFALEDSFGKKFLYRTEGDTFTLIIKDMTMDIEFVCDEVCNHFHHLIEEKGYDHVRLVSHVYTYEQPLKNIEDYYMFVMSHDEVMSETDGHESMARHIIMNVVNRLRQSLEYYEEVCNYALIDEVSGLPNAKAANQYMSTLSSNGLRRKDHYTVLFIDGDGLRRYNDISYQSGNQAIRKIGQLIHSAIRDDDKIYRWLSGDEFLVILEGTDNATGEMLAERIRTHVEDNQDGFQFFTSVSIGVASFPSDGRDVDTVIYYAEKANKIAKDRGKNQSVVWSKVDITNI